MRLYVTLSFVVGALGCGAAMTGPPSTDPTDENLDKHTADSRAAIEDTCARDADCRSGAICESGGCVKKSAR